MASRKRPRDGVAAAALCVALAAAAVTAAEAAPPADPAALLSAVTSLYIARAGAGVDGWRYEYGSAFLMSTAYEAAHALNRSSWAAVLDAALDDFLTNPTQRGYQLLNNGTRRSWDYAVGDYNVFPIAFLARLDYHRQLPSPTDAGFRVAVLTADEYLLPWPFRIADKAAAFTRLGGMSPSNGTVLWGDDSAMGFTLLARLARLAAAPRARDYVDAVAPMVISFADRLRDSVTGAMFHAYNEAVNANSCCMWGVPNGYEMQAYIDVLRALAPFNHPLLPAVLETFRGHARALVRLQADDGRFHTILNDTSTYLETSVTSMTLFSLARGVLEGHLDRGEFEPAILRAWSGLASQVLANGTVLGICEGTGIQQNVSDYQNRATPYDKSSPGLGSVMMAALAMIDFLLG